MPIETLVFKIEFWNLEYILATLGRNNWPTTTWPTFHGWVIMPCQKMPISPIMFKFGIVVHIDILYIPVHHSTSIDPSPLIGNSRVSDFPFQMHCDLVRKLMALNTCSLATKLHRLSITHMKLCMPIKFPSWPITWPSEALWLAEHINAHRNFSI